MAVAGFKWEDLEEGVREDFEENIEKSLREKRSSILASMFGKNGQFAWILGPLRAFPEETRPFVMRAIAHRIRRTPKGNRVFRELAAGVIVGVAPMINDILAETDEEKTFSRFVEAAKAKIAELTGGSMASPASPAAPAAAPAPAPAVVVKEEEDILNTLHGFEEFRVQAILRLFRILRFEFRRDVVPDVEGDAGKMITGLFESIGRAKTAMRVRIQSTAEIQALHKQLNALEIAGKGTFNNKEYREASAMFVRHHILFLEYLLLGYMRRHPDPDWATKVGDMWDRINAFAGIDGHTALDKLAKAKDSARRVGRFSVLIIGLSLAYLLYLGYIGRTPYPVEVMVEGAKKIVMVDGRNRLLAFAIDSAYYMLSAGVIGMILGIMIPRKINIPGYWKDEEANKRTWSWREFNFPPVQFIALVLTLAVTPVLLATAFVATSIFAPVPSWEAWFWSLVFILIWDLLCFRILNSIINLLGSAKDGIKKLFADDDVFKSFESFKESVFLKRIGVTAAMAVIGTWVILLWSYGWEWLGGYTVTGWNFRLAAYSIAVLGALVSSYTSSMNNTRDIREYKDDLKDETKRQRLEDTKRAHTFRNTAILIALLLPPIGFAKAKGVDMAKAAWADVTGANAVVIDGQEVEQVEHEEAMEEPAYVAFCKGHPNSPACD